MAAFKGRLWFAVLVGNWRWRENPEAGRAHTFGVAAAISAEGDAEGEGSILSRETKK